MGGFTITAGQADDLKFPDNGDGGFNCRALKLDSASSPILENVIFSSNKANFGGGVLNIANISGANSNPRFRNAAFYGNSAGHGCGMFSAGYEGGISSPNLESVTFSGNGAEGFAGAMANHAEDGGTSIPRMTNVLFSGNSAEFAGALSNAADDGTSIPLLTNVTFSGNHVKDTGGAVVNEGRESGDCNPIMLNVILWNNLDKSGPGTIFSTIVNVGAVISLSHSLVQGAGDSGSGIWTTDPNFKDMGDNIDKDPTFVASIDPTSAPTTTGDLHLKEGSPAVDAGNNIYIGSFAKDLGGKPRVVDGNLDGIHTVDMGAFEYQIDYPYSIYQPIILK